MNTKFREDILGYIKSSKEGISYRKIKEFAPSSEHLSPADSQDLEKTLREVLASLIKDNSIIKIKNPKGNSTQKTYYKFKRVVNKKSIISNPDDSLTNDKLFKGCAGEYAVMSELLFLGFDANIIAVDKGQDLLAHKEGVWYFIQVKTTALNSDMVAHWSIPKTTLNKYKNNSAMRYVLVARCKMAGKEHNRYFSFTGAEINTFIEQGLIGVQKSAITIKIRYDKDIPYMYDKQSMNARPWENFDSIIGRSV